MMALIGRLQVGWLEHVFLVVVVVIASNCLAEQGVKVPSSVIDTTTTNKFVNTDEIRQYPATDNNGKPAPYVNTICPKVNVGNTVRWNYRYHNSNTCHREQYDAHVARSTMFRAMKHKQIKETIGHVQFVPNEQSYICPLNVINNKFTTTMFNTADTDSTANAQLDTDNTVPITTQTDTTIGLDTTWVVENGSSTPIVISWLNDNGMEVSYRNNNIHPSINDPNAILQPGQWDAIHTYEGHEFVVRSVLESIDTSTGNTIKIVGPVLYQHRAGLIPVGNTNSKVQYICPDIDIEPRDALNPTIVASEFSRTVSKPIIECNTIHLGFRNMINCPVHAYFVQRGPNTNEQQQQEQEQVLSSECSEQFKFHLGINNVGTTDYMWDWTSTTKYERTYMGHSFRFRLASNPDIIVDTITIQPTIIRDCPMSLSTSTSISTGIATGIANHGPINTSSSSSLDQVLLSGNGDTTTTTTTNNNIVYYTNSTMIMVKPKPTSSAYFYSNNGTVVSPKQQQHQQQHQLPSTIVASSSTNAAGGKVQSI